MTDLLPPLCLQAAEKRKKLLDELAIKSQEDGEKFKTKLSQLELSRQQEVTALRSEHKAEVTELSELLKSEQVGLSSWAGT